MKWWRTLAEKPWQSSATGVVLATDGTELPAIRITLRFLMVVISVFFLLFFVTYIQRSQYYDFQALAGEPWQPFTHSLRLWVNTAVLLAASLAMQGAVRAVRSSDSSSMRWCLAVGGLLALLFVLLQIGVWRFLQQLGYGIGANPANSYFYLITGLHAVHIGGGLLALIWILLRLRRNPGPALLRPVVEACATYWHFLFVWWLVMFFLLTRTPHSYALIAALCGLG